jgi:hypothetical protein
MYDPRMGKNLLTLKDAIRARDLEAFIAQAEEEGIAAAEAKRMYGAITGAVKRQRSGHQSSRSPSGG